MSTNSSVTLPIPFLSSKKNLDCVYTETSEALNHLLGLSKNDQMIGRTDYELPCPASENAENFQKEDRFVMLKQRPLKTLFVFEYANGLSMILGKKFPLYEKGILVGTYVRAINVTQLFSDINRVLLDDTPFHYQLTQGTYFIGNENASIKLTPRQQECLFLLLHGKSAKQIGRQLSLGQRTVEGYLGAIKIKFGCHNKYELIDKAIYEGFLNRIPERLFSQCILPITRK
jgi:DNA-binding CsgD family transcriptional regulator